MQDVTAGCPFQNPLWIAAFQTGGHCLSTDLQPLWEQPHLVDSDALADIISFEDAINNTDGEDRALLIGNGFSARYFNYSSLLAASGLGEGTPLRNLFAALDTADFEAVVRALDGASIVEKAYGNQAHSKELETHAQEVREALVRAVNNTHPRHREDLALQYESGAKFLNNFDTVFSLNYDLLLYWLNSKTGN